MPIDLYYMALSAPCRSAMLTAKALGLEVNLKKLDLFAKEQMKPEFIAINPQHCVPTMVDGDLSLWESRAICTYLATQYGKDGSLYPSDAKARALVDRLLYFDMGTLYHRYGEYVYPLLFGGQDKPNPEKLEKLNEALGWLDSYLAGHEWAAGDNVTVADFVLVSTVATIEASGIDLSKFSNVTAWLGRCKANMAGYQEANGDGAKEFGDMAKAKLG